MGNNPSISIQSTITSLGVREQDLRTRADYYMAMARAAASKGDKTSALSHLRMKHRTEKGRAALIAAKENLMSAKFDIEMHEIMKSAFDSMKLAVKTMRSFAKKADLGKIDEIMGELNDLNVELENADAALAQPFSEPTEDIEAELERIIAAETLKAMPSPPKTSLSREDDDPEPPLEDVPLATA